MWLYTTRSKRVSLRWWHLSREGERTEVSLLRNQDVPSRGNSTCKSPEVDSYQVCRGTEVRPFWLVRHSSEVVAQGVVQNEIRGGWGFHDDERFLR